MDALLDNGLAWWITAIEIPALTGLLWMIWRTRREHEDALGVLETELAAHCFRIGENLAAFKLEVAKSYASVTDMKDLESRIVSHLLRIEAKLDRTALKTEALRGDTSDK